MHERQIEIEDQRSGCFSGPVVSSSLRRTKDRARAGFAIAPILYMLGLIGVGAAVLFSGYSQILRTNVNITNGLEAKNDLNGNATTMAATSVLSADTTVLCPPTAAYNETNNCSTATTPPPIKMAALAGQTQLPANTTGVAGTGGSTPREVGVFTAGSGMKQLDPWGHYYIVCRWENPTAPGSAPAFMIISGGPDGSLQTKCTDTAAQGDDLIIEWPVTVAINRSAVWQSTTTSGGTTQVQFGQVGTQLVVDSSGDLTTPGNVTVGGTTSVQALSATSITDSGSLTAGSVSTTGNITGNTLSISGNGTIGGTFGVTGATSLSTLATSAVATLNSAVITNNATIGGTLGVTGATSLGSLSVATTATVGGSLAVSGDTNLATTLETGGIATLNSAAITTNATIGGTLGVTGATSLSTLASTGNVGIGGKLTVTGTTGLTGALSGSSAVFTGSVTASNFIGATAGGSIVWGTAIVPLANGGTSFSATSPLDLLAYLGGTNANNLTLGTIPAGRIAAGEITSAMMAAPDVGTEVGPYYQVYVDSAGRVVTGSGTIPVANEISDGAGEFIIADSNGLTFDTSNIARMRVNINGNIGIGSTAASVSLDLSKETDAIALPSGTTAQRPGTPVDGDIRYNGDAGIKDIEAYINGAWTSLVTSGGGTTVSSGVLLGTSASATNPQRVRDASTGFYSPGAQQVAVAAGGVEVEQWNGLSGGVDFLSITPGLSGSPPSIAVAGGTANQNLNLTPAGTGSVNVNVGPAAGSTQGSYLLNGSLAIWQDPTNFNLAVGATAFPTTVDAVDGGVENTAVGIQALNANTAGQQNTAVGDFALFSNTSGGNNTAVGVLAMNANTTGNINTAVGNFALFSNTTGSANTAVGDLALAFNTTGSANTAVGELALASNTTGSFNTALGNNAMIDADIGSENVAIGDEALAANLADNEVAIGAAALQNNTTGTANTAVGFLALNANTTGFQNTAVGNTALNGNTTGVSNTALGSLALRANTTGFQNTAVGTQALILNTAGLNNTAVGFGALSVNTTGTNNTVMGYNVASTTLATGSNNILIGASSNVDTPAVNTNNFLNIGNVIFAAGMTGTVASPAGSVGIGSTSPVVSLDLSQETDALALPSGTLAQRPSGVNGEVRYSQTNSALEAFVNGTWENLLTSGGSTSTITLGTSAGATNPQRNGEAGTGLFSANSGQVSVAATGTEVGRFTSTGLNIIGTVNSSTDTPSLQLNGDNAIWQDTSISNLAVGATAFPTTVDGGVENTAVGIQALDSNTTGSLNTAVGYFALVSNTTGSNNTAVGGDCVLCTNSTGNINTAVGVDALENNRTGNNNTAIGAFALNRNTTGSFNTALGDTALEINSTGSFNTAIGTEAMGNSDSGTENSAVGDEALFFNRGDNNTAVGAASLQFNTTGVNNTAVGVFALNANTTGSNNTVLGYDVANGTLNGGSNNILIGTNNLVDTPTATTSYFLNIGNTLFATGANTGTLSSPAGNVGIGNTTPIFRLEVTPSAALDGLLIDRQGSGNTNGAAWGIGVVNAANNNLSGFGQSSTTYTTGGGSPWVGNDHTYIGYLNQLRIGIGAGSTPTMTFDNSGNVGIGSTSPVASLDLSQRIDALSLPSGSTAQRPSSAVNGMIRYNSDSGITTAEGYFNNAWQQFVTTGSGGTSAIFLGTSASANNPQRSGEAGTGLFSATSGTVSTASLGTDVMDVSATGPNVRGTITAGSYSIGYQINGSNAIWQDTVWNNLAVGSSALPTTVSRVGGGSNGQSNTTVGAGALNFNTTGYQNTAVGAGVLFINTIGGNNTAIGAFALNHNTAGGNNTAIGAFALNRNNTTGGNNTAIGASALNRNTIGGNNTAVGSSTLSHVSSGTNNVGIGYNVAGATLNGGSNNILIGTSSAVDTASSGTNYNLNIGNLLQGDMTNSTALGTEALYLQSTASSVDYLQIAGGATGSPGTVTVSGQGTDSNVSIELLPKGTGGVGIGTSAPGAVLEVSGDIKLSRGADRKISIPAPTGSGGGNSLSVFAGDAAGTSLLGGGNLVLEAGYGTASQAGGSVYLAGGAGGTVGNVVLAYDPGAGARGNVGIGSTSPVASLDISQKTDAVSLPSGTTAQRPSAVNGMVRYSQSLSALEAYVNGAWETLITGTGSTSTITLGTSAAATSPQRNGEAGTGLFSPATGAVSIASAGSETERVTGGVAIGTSYVGTAPPANGAIIQGNVGIGSASPSVALDLVGVQHETNNSIGTAAADGIVLQNTTAAAVGAQQYSPMLHLIGGGWKTAATAASQTVDWTIQNQPVQGTANPTSNLVFATQVNGGGYTSPVTVNSTGAISVANTVTGSSSAGNNVPFFTGTDTTTGFGGGTGGAPGAWLYGAQVVTFGGGGSAVGIGSTGTVGWYAGGITGGPDTGLSRLSAAVIGVGNGTNGTSGGTLIAGNIGIGSTTPVASLDLSQKTDAVALPSGTSAQRPSPVAGMVRYNNAIPQIEAYYSGAWQPLTAGSSLASITLGTAASTTNPQRSGEAGTGLFSATTGTVSVAGLGIDNVDFAAAGLNLPVVTESYKIGGNNAHWQDDANFNLAVGDTTFPTTVSQTGGGGNGQGNLAIGYQALNANTTGRQNIAIGYQAMLVNTTGTLDTALGYQALAANTLGFSNVAMGFQALQANTTGAQNTAVGGQALNLNTTGRDNTAVGTSALTLNTTGIRNTAVGSVALDSNTTGQQNTALGYFAMLNNTTGSNNVAVGATALLANTTGVSNTALGVSALVNNTMGAGNTAVGISALSTVTTGSNNTAVGDGVGAVVLATGSNNILIGTSSAVDTPAAGTSNYLNIGGTITGSLVATAGGTALVVGTATDDGAIMTFAGEGAITLPSGTVAQRPGSPANGMIRYDQSGTPALEAYVNGAWTSLITSGGSTSTITLGTSASVTNPQRSGEAGTGLYSATSGTVSVAGTGTDNADITAAGLNLPVATESYKINGSNAIWQSQMNSNLAVGVDALLINSTGSNNTAVGPLSLGSNTTGNGNTAVGVEALGSNTTGTTNTAVGLDALFFNATGSFNTALGTFALLANTTGSFNTALGSNAMIFADIGSENVAVGDEALAVNFADNEVAIGAAALQNNTTGTANTAVGFQALNANTTGSNNTALGNLVGSSTLSTGSNNILIGTSSSVDTPAAGTNNFLNIGNVIFATGMTGSLSSPAGNVGIGTASPGAGLDIANAGAAATPAERIEGAWYTSGTATTNKPQLLIEPSGTTSNAWSTSGTGLGINSASSFNGNLVDAQNSGLSLFHVSATGDVGGITGEFYRSNVNTGQLNIVLRPDLNYIGMMSDQSLVWKSVDHTNSFFSGGSTDTGISRLGAAKIAVGNSTQGDYSGTLIASNVGIGSTSPNSSFDISQKTDAVSLPSGTTAQRPSPVNGMVRYSQSLSALEAYVNGAWETLITGTGSTSTINLGTAATATNPARSSEVGTGLFSATTGTVSIAGLGTDNADFAAAGLNLPVATESYKINGINAIWQDTNFNLAVGATALPTTVSLAGGGDENTAVGYQALNTNTSGSFNTAVGNSALSSNTTANANTAVGSFALSSNTTGASNNAFGASALGNNTSGNQNSAFGDLAMTDNTIGAGNTAVGGGALLSNITGSANVAVGLDALENNTTGTFNTAFGTGAMVFADTGSENVAVGNEALAFNLADNEVAVGAAALQNNTTGTANTAVGFQALNANTTGTGNTALGNLVGSTTLSTGSNNILIGTSSSVDTPAAGTNNFLNIGNVIFATGMTGSLSSPAGNVGIGVASPPAKLTLPNTLYFPPLTTYSQYQILLYDSGTAAASEGIGVEGGGGYIGFNAAVGHKFYHAGGSTPDVIITGASVGIGSGSPIASLDISQKTDAVSLPSGTTAQRPSPVNGMVRYSQSLSALEAYVNGAWETLITGTGSTAVITLGTSASATNPQRSGEAGTGLFSATTGTVSIAAAGADVVDFSATSENLLGTIVAGSYSIGYEINGSNAIWQDPTNFNLAVGATAFPTTVDAVDGGIANTAVGIQALNANTTGGGNTALGYQALAANTSGFSNVAMGFQALNANTTGDNNTAVGELALVSNTAGFQNTAVGYFALVSNSTGVNNTAVGDQALESTTTGSFNTALGNSAMIFADIGSENVAVGDEALAFNLADDEVAIGAAALQNNTTGTGNTAVGFQALNANTTGSNNTALGNLVGSTTLSTGSNNILIGTSSSVDTPAAGTNNFLNIGNVIFATGMTGSLSSPAGSVGIGTTSPMRSLDVVGGVRIQAGNGDTYIDTNGFGPRLYNQTAANNIFTVEAGHAIVFSPNDTETLRLVSGLVGIGSTSPNSSLDISQKTDAVSLPSGTSAQRPAGVNGMIRYSQSNTAIEAYYGGAWNTLSSSGGGSSINLGTSASVTNPQRSSDATTGLFSASTGTVSVAAAGTDEADFVAAGLNLPVATESYKINGVNAVWQDNTNFNLAVGNTGFPATIAQGGFDFGQFVTGVGYHALNANTTGGNNTAVGSVALAANTTGTENTAVGSNALATNTTGQFNVAVGDFALNVNTTSNNTALGSNALSANTAGNANTAAGSFALSTNTTGANNSALGYQALFKNTSGNSNTAIGYQAASNVTTGGANTVVGTNALHSNTTGGNNTALGFQAGYDVTTGNHNIIVGDYVTTGVGITSGTNNILIGQDVQELTATSSNQLDIGNLIFATGLASGSTMSTGNVGIGTASPSSPLTIASTTSDILGLTGSNGSATRSIAINTAGRPLTTEVGARISFIDDGNYGAHVSIATGTGPGNLSPTERMRITTAGNVGIGSASPGYALDISNPTSGTNAPFLRVGNSGGGSGNTVGIYLSPWSTRAGGDSTYIKGVDDGAFSASLTFGTAPTGSASSTVAERMRITSAGNVGIGTTSPQSKLQIAGRETLDDSGNFELMANWVFGSSDLYLNTGYAGRIEFNDSAGNWYFETAPSGSAGASVSSATTKLTILNGGNVGIGTTSPGYRLMVNGINNASIPLVISTSTSPYNTSDYTGIGFSGAPGINAKAGIFLSDSNPSYSSWGRGDMIFAINNAGDATDASPSYERMRITADGFVGIGTTSPAQALEVNGKIQVDSLASASSRTLCINSNVISSCSSSRRYKENIQDLDMGLEELMKMRPVSFKWKGRDENDFGFIAEEMHEINPILDTYEKGRIEGVKYPQLTAVIVKAIQKQQKQIETDHKVLADLRTSTDENKSNIADLRKQVGALSSGHAKPASAVVSGASSSVSTDLGSDGNLMLLFITAGSALLALAGMGGMGIMMFRMRRQIRELSVAGRRARYLIP
jgi:hypothetical protein